MTPPSPGPGLDTRQRTEQTGLCRGQTAYSGNGEPGYPKWPGAVAILVPFVVVVVVVVLVVVVTVVIVVVVVAAFLRTGVLFHHDLLVPPGSGWGSGACLPSSLFFGSGACLPSSLFFGFGACLPSLFFLSSGKGFCSIMIYWFLPLRAGVPVLVSLLFPFFSGKAFCSIMIYWFVPLRAGVPLLVSLFLPFFFSGKGFCSMMDFVVHPASGWGSGVCLPSSLFFLFSTKVCQTVP